MVLMSQIFTTYGMSVANSSTLGGASVIFGSVVSIAFGLYLDKTRAYRKSLILTTILPGLALAGFTQALGSSFNLVLAFGTTYTALTFA